MTSPIKSEQQQVDELYASAYEFKAACTRIATLENSSLDYKVTPNPEVMRLRRWRRLVAEDPEVMDAYHSVQLDMAIRDWCWL